MLKKNSIPVQIREENFEIVVNIGSMLDVEELTGNGFMQVLAETENGKLFPSLAILSCCLRREGADVGVGMDYLRSLETEEFSEISVKMIEGIMNSLPKFNGDEKN